ncbi:hypothetical protein D8674_005934 [Pyrus ussuriensis x Pyrus communis]|uniref:Retrotransposon gag domain-containing protein n=1 Tax=Pyrus ussuriensis x Pyrus communis TaxID=2448454 RepID=A0A5N5FTI4_9ROSA|nr:hypothetical protein D8674_005934 [Pyrus ussuriensis x Pyrus communis]
MLDIIAAIHAFGEAQKEIVAYVKELKNSIPKPSEKASGKGCTPREKISQEESVVAAGKGSKNMPSFVTQENVITMLEKELNMSSKDWKYVPKPPYPFSLLYMPYPKGYETLNLVLFDRRKGSPNKHISYFIDILGLHVGDYNLHLREFSNSLINCAYTWYTTLTLSSIRTWEKLVGKFSLDYYDEKDDKALVEICIRNIVADYRVYLESIGIAQFLRLLEVVRKTIMLVKRRGKKTVAVMTCYGDDDIYHQCSTDPKPP